MKNSYLVNSVVLMVCALALVFATQHVSRSEEKQKENIARLVGMTNGTSEIKLFGPVHPTTITFEGFDGEVIWMASRFPSREVPPNGDQVFQEVGKIGIESVTAPRQVSVPSDAKGYVVRSFGAPFNQ